MSLNSARPMRLLWLWWWVCLIGLVLLWLSSLHGQSLAALNARRTLLLSEIASMDERLSALRRFQETLLKSWKSQLLLGQDPRAEEMSQHALPFAHLYYRDKTGQWVPTAPPLWLDRRIQRESQNLGADLVEFRPLPPGLGAGRKVAQADLPAHFYCMVLPVRAGSLLVSECRLDYLADQWLPNQRNRMGFGGDLQIECRFLDPLDIQDQAVERPNSIDSIGWRELLHPTPWKWRANQLFPGDPRPIGDFYWSLDNAGVQWEILKNHLLGLLAGASVMVGFACAIVLLRRAAQREAQQIQERERFQQMVSHDLRTPVSAIAMYSEILQHDLVSEAAKKDEYFQLLATEVQQLQILIDNFLNLGSLDNLVVEPGGAAVDLGVLVEQIAQRLGATRPGTVVYRNDGFHGTVSTSTVAVTQILVNLIQNALKYGLPKGTGPEAAVLVRLSSRESWAVVEVIDQGPGIAPEEQATVFQAFVRGKMAGQQSGRGVGLGLAVAQGLAQRIGGRLELESSSGCTFRLLLPL